MLRNMQHLCNLMRPVQARQTLLHTLEAEVQQRRAAAAELRCGVGVCGVVAKGSAAWSKAKTLCSFDSRFLTGFPCSFPAAAGNE